MNIPSPRVLVLEVVMVKPLQKACESTFLYLTILSVLLLHQNPSGDKISHGHSIDVTFPKSMLWSITFGLLHIFTVADWAANLQRIRNVTFSLNFHTHISIVNLSHAIVIIRLYIYEMANAPSTRLMNHFELFKHSLAHFFAEWQPHVSTWHKEGPAIRIIHLSTSPFRFFVLLLE